ncbi:MAG: glucose-6-phosphate dehydrogenase [Candidatus Peribacteraceae bacterium]|nr:glucose-6-phosphate dehydrogenase [Candidatus Peribacteraceae bacterium]
MKPLSAPTPFSFVLFGASGNLAKLKIYPALYVLALKKRFPEHYAIVGYSRTEMSDAEFKKLVEESIHAQMPEVNKKVLEDFLARCHYVAGQYDSVKDFQALAKQLTVIEKGWKDAVRLTYLSIPPTVFTQVLDNICAGGVHDKKIPFRCIVEKPVGHDLKSFEEIQAQLHKCFKDEEIYLLDHYLGKEAVRNVYYLRFANPMLERLFKNSLIHHVEVMASESYGLEGRSGYFEHTGTFRDMFQSHILMMISLLTMLIKEGDDTLRESRLNALKQFYLPPASDLNDVILQGQYTKGKVHGETVVGYREEDEIPKDSRTNTFAAMKLLSREARWQGVPFYLRSGKRLGKKETRISIQFQEPHVVGEGSTPNRLDIILQGEAGMRIHLQTKIGGTTPTFRPLILEDPLVCMGDCLPEHGILLLEAIHGKQSWFLTFDEVRTSWRLIDPLQHHLEQPSTPLHLYPAGTNGPAEADAWAAKDGVKWVG